MKIKKFIGIITIMSLIFAMNIMPVLASQTAPVTSPSNSTDTTSTTNTTSTTSTATNVPKTITKTYSFKTDTKPFKYDPTKKIKEGEYEYEYKGKISYVENSATQPVKETKSFTNLTSKSVPNSITSNGKTLYLSGSPTYTAHTTPAQKSTQTVTDTKTYNKVTPGTESSVIKETVEKDGITLKKSKQNYSASIENFNASGKLASYDHDMNVSGTSIQLSDSTPQQGSWQEDLRIYFGLPSTTSISNASWASDIQHNTGSNKYTRTVNYSGTRTVYNYTVTYSGTKTVTTSPEKTTYNATATYASKDKTEYAVTATVTYELTQESIAAIEAKEREEQERIEQEQREQEEQIQQEEQEKQEEEQKEIEKQKDNTKRNILIGSGIGLLALLGLIIALLIAKRKKPEENADDLNKLFDQASIIKTNKNTAKKESEKQRAAEQKKEQLKKEKEEKARKAAEEKERRRIEKEKAYEKKKAENQKRNDTTEKSDFMKKLDQIKQDISTDDEIKK